MVLVSAPLLSLDASGSLAGAIVFSKWKGRNYVRQLVKPANPRSGGQVGIRSMFKFLSQIWDGLTAGNKATWEDRAEDMIASDFNAFVSYNMNRWRNFTTPSKEDPATVVGTNSDISNEDATAGERSITVSGDSGVGAEQWGVLIFRALATPVVTAWDNCIAAVPCAASSSFSYVDSPLDPDTYYYNFRSFTDDGVMGDEETEVDAEVT